MCKVGGQVALCWEHGLISQLCLNVTSTVREHSDGKDHGLQWSLEAAGCSLRYYQTL